MKRIKSAIAGVILAGLSAVSSAGMILTSGTNQIGWTDNNGNNWLRLDDSVHNGSNPGGLTFADYENGINAYGFDWELATRAEVAALWGEFEPNAASGTYAPFSNTLAVGALAMRNVFGYTSLNSQQGLSQTYGFSADTWRDINGTLLGVYAPRLLLDYAGNAGGTSYYDEDWTVNKLQGDNAAGFRTAWLIAPATAVPTPSVALLFASGLLVMITRTRRRS